jgi:hypothetical protein
MMPIRYAALILAAALFVPSVYSQNMGVVEGRLIDGTDPTKALAGLSVDAIQPASGMTALKSAKTDSAGKFQFSGLPTMGPLLIRADYREVSYFSPVTFDERGKAQIEMRVYETTDSARGIRLANLQIAFKLSSDGLRALESYEMENQTKPPSTFMRADGNFRISKVPGITDPPSLDVTSPGSSMPVTQAPLESADGQSYYSLYPLKPGTTTFEVGQQFPWQNGSFTFRKKFYQDVGSVKIGVIPRDMTLSGQGLAKVQTDAAQNFAVYAIGPIKAGTEVVWTLSGGTPVADSPAPPPSQAPQVQIMPMPNLIGQNALIIGPLLLLGLVIVLWHASSRVIVQPAEAKEARAQELRERREQLLNYVAALDAQYEKQALDRRRYVRLREQGKRHLRRIAMLLEKKR